MKEDSTSIRSLHCHERDRGHGSHARRGTMRKEGRESVSSGHKGKDDGKSQCDLKQWFHCFLSVAVLGVNLEES